MSERPAKAAGMNPKRRQLLAVARKRLGMVAEDWRELLREHGGVNHSRDLDDDDFDRVMMRLRQLGFTSAYWQAGYGERRDMASPHQLHKIRELWRGAVDQPADAHLYAWLEKMFKVSALRFLTAEKARKVITALKAMEARRRMKAGWVLKAANGAATTFLTLLKLILECRRECNWAVAGTSG